MKSEIIIFYDGICILCSNAMNFIQRNDKKNLFLFSPLQSSYAQRTIDPKFIRDMNTVAVMRDGKIFTKSKAAFVILDTLNHPFKYLKFILPNFITDMLYEFVAKRRYNWFGKKEECIFPIDNPKFLID